MPSRLISASVWPDNLIPKSVSVTMDRPVFKGPKPLSGREQVVAVDSGGWAISYDNIVLAGSARYLAFRKIWAETVGAALPVYIAPDFGPHTPAVRFGMTSSPTNCYLSSSTARGATTIPVTNSSGYALQAGDYFEINGRLHVIRSISGSSWTIWPPLRSYYNGSSYQTNTPSLTSMEIYDPRCLMYAVSDSKSNSMTLGDNAVGSVSLEFVEANW